MSTINPPKCIKCGELNSPRATSCIMCGNPLLTVQQQVTESTATPNSEIRSTVIPHNRVKFGVIFGLSSIVTLVSAYALVKAHSVPQAESSRIISTEFTRPPSGESTVGAQNPTLRMKAANIRKLIQAAKTGDIPTVRAFLDAGNSPDTPIPNKARFSILMYAASGNQVEMIRFLLDKGANVEYKSADGYTPLMLAGMRGSMEAAQFLLSVGANVKTKSNGGMSALSFSVAAGKVNTVNLLLDKGSDPNNAPPNGSSELHMAAGLGHVEIAKMLMAKGANPQAKDEYGSTPLDYAVKSGHDDVAQLLR